MDVSIIIVNYNTADLVARCIESIINYVKDIEYEIIVVDNLSEDRSVEILKNKFANTEFYFRDVNLGFGSGCNFGFTKSRGKYILFLNPDTFLISNIVKEFFLLLESEKKIGVCSALLEDYEGNLQYCFNDFPGIKWELLELTGRLSNLKVKNMLDKARKMKNGSGRIEIGWAIGACLFLRREIFETIGGFDEDFFLYYEDTDLQKRIKDEGFKVELLNKMTVKHEGKSSIDKTHTGDNIYHLNMHISKMKYYKKHTNKMIVFIIRIINITAFMLRLFALPFRSKKKIPENKKNIIVNILKIYFGLHKYNTVIQ